MLVDRNQIANALPLFFGPDDVFEVRALDVERPGRIAGGFVESSRIPRMVSTIAELARKSSGVYFTPQLLNRELLSRSKNFIPVPHKSKSLSFELSKDDDIIARRYFLIDTDPVKPPGFKKHSATELEKAAVKELVTKVRGYLAVMGWPAPLVVDSGNGFHLYYRLLNPFAGGSVPDSRKDDFARLLAVLKAKFDTGGAQIDHSMFTPSRIMKIPGTPSRKGDATTERPHRMSALLEVPSDWTQPITSGNAASADVIEKTFNDLDPDGSIRNGPPVPEAPAVRPRAITTSHKSDPIERAREWIRSGPPAISGNKGHNRTLTVAQAMVRGFLLSREDAIGVMMETFVPMSPPDDRWKHKDIEYKVDEALKHPNGKPEGWLLNGGREDMNLLSQVDSDALNDLLGTSVKTEGQQPRKTPVEPDLNEAEDDPHRLARAVLTRYQYKGERTLAYWRGSFHEWREQSYRERADAEFRAFLNQIIYRELATIQKLKIDARKLAASAPSGDAELPKMPKVTRILVSNVTAALEGKCIVRDEVEAPAWLSGIGPDPREIVVTANGLIHLPSYAESKAGAIQPHTPDFFTFNALPFAVSADAPQPERWLKFLGEIWPDDPDSIALLQEWFGYLLTPDTRQQKILLLKGPTGAGKGTIARVIQALIGPDNCATPGLSDLGEPFGLSSLVGKSVAVVGEAKLSHRDNVSLITQRLLSISGEDRIDVNRKNQSILNMQLKTRFVLAANLPPTFDDMAAAFDRRWSPIMFTKSFKDRKDIKLFDRLKEELPGIFNWAVAGWLRLNRQEAFTEPATSRAVVSGMGGMAGAVREFVASCCAIDKNSRTLAADFHAAFKRWSEENDIEDSVSKKQLADMMENEFAESVRHERIGPNHNRGPYYYVGIGLRSVDSPDRCSYDSRSESAPPSNTLPFGEGEL